MNAGTKINQLLTDISSGSILLTSWLKMEGYSYELQQRYRDTGWLTTIGKGAMVRSGQKLMMNSAIYALQQQAGLKIHVGGRSALGMQGLAHYLEIDRKETLLFGQRGVRLPAWFKGNKWDTRPILIISSFLPPDLGLIEFDESGFKIKISGPARAIMECLELAPRRFDLAEVQDLMESLNFLQPAIVQILLEHCSSIKVKRLFLYFAEKAGHSWFKYLQLDKITLGSGKRSLASNGILVPKYQITLPKNLV